MCKVNIFESSDKRCVICMSKGPSTNVHENTKIKNVTEFSWTFTIWPKCLGQTEGNSNAHIYKCQHLETITREVPEKSLKK